LALQDGVPPPLGAPPPPPQLEQFEESTGWLFGQPGWLGLGLGLGEGDGLGDGEGLGLGLGLGEGDGLGDGEGLGLGLGLGEGDGLGDMAVGSYAMRVRGAGRCRHDRRGGRAARTGDGAPQGGP